MIELARYLSLSLSQEEVSSIAKSSILNSFPSIWREGPGLGGFNKSLSS
ncbi:MAG: hypothetical protein HKN68_07810 [Saprospiraceae bacterium]|nr:hypothetical protein [Saprospiraceae bacterium]